MDLFIPFRLFNYSRLPDLDVNVRKIDIIEEEIEARLFIVGSYFHAASFDNCRDFPQRNIDQTHLTQDCRQNGQ